MDQNMQPQPQMVGSFDVSPDHRTYTFRLRDGLSWHDGAPVTAEDCIASLRRWGARDGEGQVLMANVIERRTERAEAARRLEDMLVLGLSGLGIAAEDAAEYASASARGLISSRRQWH
jgi:hypothetical protein